MGIGHKVAIGLPQGSTGRVGLKNMISAVHNIDGTGPAASRSVMYTALKEARTLPMEVKSFDDFG